VSPQQQPGDGGDEILEGIDEINDHEDSFR
jgi:hypothetical protein